MRKLLLLIILLAIIIAAAPFIDGYLFKQQFMTTIFALPQTYKNKSVKFDVVEYHQGWLHSTAKLRVSFTDPKDQQILPGGINADVEITHGPIVYNSVKDTYALAMASMNNKIYLPAVIQQMIAPSLQSAPLVETYTIASFANTWSTLIKISPITIPYVGTLTIADSSTTDEFTSINNKLVKIDIGYDTGAITFKSAGTMPSIPSFYILPGASAFTATRNIDNSWNSISQQSFQSIAATWPSSQSITINNIVTNTKSGLGTNKLYQVSSDLTIRNITTPNFVITSMSGIKGSFSITDLNPAGLDEYQNATGDDFQTAASVLKKVFTATTNINLALAFNSDAGALSSIFKLS